MKRKGRRLLFGLMLALLLAMSGAACIHVDDCDDDRRECMEDCDRCSSCDTSCYDACDY